MVLHPNSLQSSPHFHVSTPWLALVLAILALMLAACSGSSLSPAPASSAIPTASNPPKPVPAVNPTSCALAPVTVPTLPAEIPGYTELDPSTGLHVTSRYTKPIDMQTYRLEVAGRVEHPLSLSYDELRCMPRVEKKVTLVCPGFFEDVTTFAGTPLAHILELAEAQEDADHVELISADGYSIELTLEEAQKPENFLAYEWKGEPLPILHGFPLRAVFPARDGGIWVKWLVKLNVE
jgi:DMSO/TMAO reductase YedYZ molybdopterin-dependent catalytic subunit